MAETNPQPVQEAAPQAAPTKGGGSLMGPIVAAIILVAGIAGIFKFMVKGALETTGAKTSFPDCLLYTSPSPRDLSTSRMPSSA